MTLWLDKATFRNHIENLSSNINKIEKEQIGDDRYQLKATFSGSVEASQFDLSSLTDYLSALRGGDPQVNIYSENGNIAIGIEADESVYREKL